MRIEVAIRALALAPGDMDIQTKGDFDHLRILPYRLLIQKRGTIKVRFFIFYLI